ncbi:hypothetical protein GN316_04480 [Xylophilus sp. Kf1]|nr:hypothetical protein [Xylophilus sp. Kf1]
MSMWLTALKLVPWDDVLKSTPGLVRQAKQLFKSSKAERPAATTTDLSAQALNGRDHQAVAEAVQALLQRVHLLEEEQRKSAALMESLAEQHEMVVQAMGAMRARTKLLTVVSGVLVLAVLGLLTWISRH